MLLLKIAKKKSPGNYFWEHTWLLIASYYYYQKGEYKAQQNYQSIKVFDSRAKDLLKILFYEVLF